MDREFGAYETVQRIGVGGMATVYTAVQKSLGRTVVLKTMHEHLREDPTFVARFEREARAAAAMSHENVVQIIDYGTIDGTSYIAMEHVNGPDLKKWIEKHGTPPIEIGTLILCEICAGLAHAHAHHIVHRDIKPANIMLAPTGVPKLADFGLAKQTQESTVLTVHETMIGTVPYMSPEHATGQHVDERSDIFSLGIVAYEIFGGRRPFPGDSSASVIHAIVTLEPASLSVLNPLVTDDLHRIVSRMLEKDPARRYQAAGEVRRDFEAVIDRWGVTRAHDFIAEYIAAPEETRKNLTLRRFKEHLNRAHHFKGMGLGKIDDAIREFERAHYLDPADGNVTRNLEILRAKKPPSRARALARLFPRTLPRLFARAKGRALIATAGAAALVLAALGARIAFREEPTTPEPTAASTRRNEAALVSAAGEARTAHREAPAMNPGVTTDEPETATRPREEIDTRTPRGESLLSDDTETRTRRGEDAGLSEHRGRTTAQGSERRAEPRPSPPQDPETARTRTGPNEGESPATETTPAPLEASGGAPRPSGLAAPPVAANGALEITARPSARFVVNGRVIAEDVSAVSLLFPPGAYEVRLENPYYGTKAWSGVEVASGETKTLAHDFTREARGAFLVITTNRIPALIWIDGAPTDKWTPQRSLPIAPGLHRVTVKKDGFTVEEGTIEAAVRDGASIELSFTLKEIAKP